MKWSSFVLVAVWVLLVIFIIVYAIKDSYVHRTIETWQGKVTYISYNDGETILNIGGRLLVFDGAYTYFVLEHCYQVWFDHWGRSEHSYVYALDRSEEQKCP